MWVLLNRPIFIEWFKSLNSNDKINVRASLSLLEELGPTLTRPHADTLKGTKLSNLKELRVQSDGKPIRIFFAFDPIRQCIILCGGDKSKDKRFYKKMILIADAEFQEHLQELNDEQSTNERTR
ncbi:type II toxin-antitoxin system RelE/ParE family toxin [Vibrio agarivorans]|uniref:Type II toxin-antitoxin system RelE/ParE family toxin n=1 Tax=Vibrio agarivorans TaxID=153622 RepID=A0ABT7Y554_9VIBR|nr:type II toxin-antitoxin system RelE/ParE family toxin [Vibrio agarivorans]MDN2483171.1 type II toxin-antitoxin system RelE/ParE family toxin [Vibrio agarivorans]